MPATGKKRKAKKAPSSKKPRAKKAKTDSPEKKSKERKEEKEKKKTKEEKKKKSSPGDPEKQLNRLYPYDYIFVICREKAKKKKNGELYKKLSFDRWRRIRYIDGIALIFFLILSSRS